MGAILGKAGKPMAPFYVDSLLGNDNFDGRSPQTAWKTLRKVNAVTFQPGDEVRFARGGVWRGQLHPLGSGREGAPIRVGSYGQGPKPILQGTGATGMLEGAVVLLYNQDFWEVEDLDVSHPADEEGERFGILARWHDYGVGRHIVIRHCDVHDIAGYTPFRFKGDGILIVATGSRIPTRCDDVLLEGNRLWHIRRTGITVWSQWAERGRVYFKPGQEYQYHTTVGPYTPHTRVVLRGNVLDDIAGDGILVTTCKGALIEHNVASNCNAYNGQAYGDANVAIWPQNSDDVVMQYNEAYLTHSTQDGQGFDLDFELYRPVVQYNYSHDNEGGFLLVMEEVYDPIIRYNLSVRDGHALFDLRSTNNVQIYNNTFDMGSSRVFRGDCRGAALTNNLFLCHEAVCPDWGQAAYDHNAYAGVEPPEADAAAVVGDPGLVAPGQADVGRDSAAGYRLQAGSPLEGAGAEVPGCGPHDFFDAPIRTPPSIGAAQ